MFLRYLQFVVRFLFISVHLHVLLCISQAAPVIDGAFADWGDIQAVEDPSGDASSGGVDFLLLKHYIGEHEVFFYVKTAEAIDWRASNIKLYVDTDGNSTTGLPFGTVGPDFVWDFSSGFGRGTFHGATGTINLGKGTFISAGAPIEPSSEYEFSIPLAHFGEGTGNAVDAKVFFRANNVGDFLPDEFTGYTVEIPQRQSHRRIKANWGKIHPNDVRIITWNVYQDGPYDPEKDAGAFGRQLQALAPDIIHFQELYAASAIWVRQFLQEWIPAPEGRFWFTAKKHDCITASLYPITRSWAVDNNLFVEINMESVWGTKAVMLNAHTPAFTDGEPGRVEETKSILSWIVDARENGILEEETPLLLTGDFNTGTTTPELISMRTGIYPDGSGRRAQLAQDFGQLTDLSPVHFDGTQTWTWHPSPERGRGRLDYIFYPFDQLRAVQSFVLAPESLSQVSIERVNMLNSDKFVADHKIVGGDFRLQESIIPGTPLAHFPDYINDGYSTILRLYEPWFYGYGIGWMWCDRSSYDVVSGSFWVWHEVHGWVSTQRTIWPLAWSYVSEEWIRLESTNL
jgi:endonuclease/exonuclease/phosphatase family metal-dependent hydrolase